MAKKKTPEQELDSAFDAALADLGMDDLAQLSKLDPEQMDQFLESLDLPIEQFAQGSGNDPDGQYEETDSEEAGGDDKKHGEDEEEGDEEGDDKITEVKKLLCEVADIDLPDDTDESDFMDHLYVALKTARAHREGGDDDDQGADEPENENKMKEENPQMVSMSLLTEEDEYDGFTDFSQLDALNTTKPFGPSRIKLLDAFKQHGINKGVFPKTETAADAAFGKLSQMSILQSAKHQPKVSTNPTEVDKPVPKKKGGRAGKKVLQTAKRQTSVSTNPLHKQEQLSMSGQITDPLALEQLSLMQDRMTEMNKREYTRRLDGLLESGRIKPELHKQIAEGLGTYQFSAANADDDADLDERLKIYEDLPEGTFFDVKQKAAQMSKVQEESLRVGFASTGGIHGNEELSADQVKAIVDDQFRANSPGRMRPAPPEQRRI